MAGLRPDLQFPDDDNGRARHFRRLLPGAGAARPHPDRAGAERPLRRRNHPGVRAAARRILQDVRARRPASRPTARTAELVKLTENAYRDTNIAFANELSMICDRFGIDVWEVIDLANRHPRVNILKPGPGVGGHCIAVDPWFIVDAAPQEARADPHRARGQRRQGGLRLRAARTQLIDSASGPARSPASASPSRPMSTTCAKARRSRSCSGSPTPMASGSRSSSRSSSSCPHDLAEKGARKIDLDACACRIRHPDPAGRPRRFRRIDAGRRNGAIIYDTRGAWRK